MLRTLLKSKIHRATVTGSELHYEGSITLPRSLMSAANLCHYEQVDILNVQNGARFTTYVIEGHHDGEITINGPAARLVQVGDMIIVCAYGLFSEDEVAGFTPTVLQMSPANVPA